MITYYTRKELDIEKYDACISKAINSRIYAYSWYLDLVTDNWNVLVFNDYEAVMPLPIRRKFFLTYVYVPAWIQQLGIFYKNYQSELVVKSFLKSIPPKIRFVETFLNTENKIQSKYVKSRVNYILKLNTPYEQLFKNYRKGRKSDVKKGKEARLKINEVSDASRIISLFKETKEKSIDRSSGDYATLNRLSKQLIVLEKAVVFEVFNTLDVFLGGAIFLIDSKRITYLFSAINNEGRQKKVMSVIIDSMINRFSETAYIFDFEGSMNKDIASFFKSFGGIKEDYYHYKRFRV